MTDFYISDFWHNFFVLMAMASGFVAFGALIVYYVELMRRR